MPGALCLLRASLSSFINTSTDAPYFSHAPYSMLFAPCLPRGIPSSGPLKGDSTGAPYSSLLPAFSLLLTSHSLLYAPCSTWPALASAEAAASFQSSIINNQSQRRPSFIRRPSFRFVVRVLFSLVQSHKLALCQYMPFHGLFQLRFCRLAEIG